MKANKLIIKTFKRSNRTNFNFSNQFIKWWPNESWFNWTYKSISDAEAWFEYSSESVKPKNQFLNNSEHRFELKVYAQIRASSSFVIYMIRDENLKSRVFVWNMLIGGEAAGNNHMKTLVVIFIDFILSYVMNFTSWRIETSERVLLRI